MYPKKSNEIAISFRSQELNQHKFDFSGIFKKFTKIFSKFNFFLQSSSTTEAPDSNENSSSTEESDQSSSEDTDNFSGENNESNVSEEVKSSSTGYSYPTPHTTKNGYTYPAPETTKTENIYTTESYQTEAISYLPPVQSYLPPSRPPLGTYLLKSESPVKVSLSTN